MIITKPNTELSVSHFLSTELRSVCGSALYWDFVLDTVGKVAYRRNMLDRSPHFFTHQDIAKLSYADWNGERLALMGELRDGMLFLTLITAGPTLRDITVPGAVDTTVAGNSEDLREFFTADLLNQIPE